MADRGTEPDQKVHVLVAEDDSEIRDVYLEFLKDSFSGYFSQMEVVASIRELRGRLTAFQKDLSEPLLLLIDIGLSDGHVCLREVLTVLARVQQRVAVIFESGDTQGLQAQINEVPPHDTVFVQVIQKPFHPNRELLPLVQKALSHLLERPVFAASLSPLPRPTMAVAAERDNPFSVEELLTSSSLVALMQNLPSDSSGIIFGENLSSHANEFLHHFARLVRMFFLSLRWALGQPDTKGMKLQPEPDQGSFKDFKTLWLLAFPFEKNESRRCLFCAVLAPFPGAMEIVSGCIHNVNNLLVPYAGNDPSPDEWEKLRFKIFGISNEGFGVFEQVPSPNPRIFFQTQNIRAALQSEFSGQEDSLGIHLNDSIPESLVVDMPAGTFSGIFETLHSNYLKVWTRSDMIEKTRRMEVSMRVEGDQVVILIDNNLELVSDRNLAGFFDRTLESEHGGGSGTGINWIARVVQLSNGEITSYHRRGDGGILEKRPGSEPCEVVVEQGGPPVLPDGMNTRFEMRFPIERERK